MNSRSELAAQMFYAMSQSLGTLGIFPPRDHDAAPFAISRRSIPQDTSPGPPSLCDRCNKMTMKDLDGDPGYKHSDDLAGLIRSAETCDICRIIEQEICNSLNSGRPHGLPTMGTKDILEELEKFTAPHGWFIPARRPIFLKIQSFGSPHCQHKSFGSNKGKTLQISTVFFHPTTMRIVPSPSLGILTLHDDAKGSPRPLCNRGSQEETISRMSEWLEQREQQTSHTQAHSPLPTRLLDLGQPGQGGRTPWLESDLRLAETTGHHGRYMTLSYSWGNYKRCRTLLSNYQERLSNIPYNILPAVFAQAVKLTRALGVRYLWIDALCIIQEDSEDWRREAASMSDIYWNAVCRLAVTNSKNPTESFFPPQPIITSVPVPHLKGPEIDHANGKEEGNLYLTLPKFYSDDVDKGHLNTRGWVLQERLLSPRTIHFSRDHIYCEDEEDICGEDWVRRHFTWLSVIDKISQSSQIDLFPDRHGIQRRDDPHMPPSYPKEDYHLISDPWLRIPEIFSKCQLSHQTDRLAAIAGLVKRKQQSPYNGARNFLGLWEESLQVELGWVSCKGSQLKFLPQLGLPSWTWISYDGPLVFTKDRRSHRDSKTVRHRPAAEFKLIQANVPDITAALPLTTPASLTLNMTIQKLPSVSSHEVVVDFMGKTREDIAKSSPFQFNAGQETVHIPLSELAETHELYDDDGTVLGFGSFDEGDQPSSDLYCAHLSTLRDSTFYHLHQKDPVGEVGSLTYFDHILAYALILVRVDGKESQYRRVGLAEVNYKWAINGTRAGIELV